jgi:uncharacterized membrane protein
MTDQAAATSGNNPAEGKTANIVYILYLVGLIVGITSLVGIVMAYINRGAAPEWVQTHFRYQIRTFWIGLLFGIIAIATMIILIGWVIMAFVVVWWVVRCIKGFQAIGSGQPIENPATWLW